MEAVVLGGGGLTGRCTVRDLAQGGRFDRIRVADLDGDLAAAAARATGSDRVTAEALDVREPARLRATLRGASVCVNAVQYVHHLPIMEGCLAEGVPYLDFGGLFHTTQRQLMLSKRFQDAGLLAIPGLGQVPGASNVLAAATTEDLDHVESLIFRDGWRDLTVGGPEIYFPWSPSTFLDEMELPAMVWEEGAYASHPPMSAAEEYDFPPPIGRTRVYRTLHSEAATLPHSLRGKGLRHCEWKEGGPGIDLLRQLALLGLGSQEPVPVRGVSVVPRELFLALLKQRKFLGVPEGIAIDDWEVLDVEVRGTRAGRAVVRHALARFPPKRSWGFTATEYAVGVCGAIGAELLVEGVIRDTGVIPPEVCVPAPPFRAALRARGIETTIAPDEGTLPPFRPAGTA
ncbi:MAG TPA: saccharopine dehydrogenase C-terminal domain-containing protein [Thermoplasmata archaeon]|nr:saccharopine dehydrogenase C-terminal domain-containing protein [Thermoplasmata archaeon]